MFLVRIKQVKKLASGLWMAVLLGSITPGAQASDSVRRQEIIDDTAAERMPLDPVAPSGLVNPLPDDLKEEPAVKPLPESGEQPEVKTWQPTPQKTFTTAQKVAECKRYEGSLISYYDVVYKVEKCHRREIADLELVQKINKGNRPIHVVDSDTVIMLEEGDPISSVDGQKFRTCRELNGQYVTYLGAESVYLVEDCKKRIFPDFDTYENHREVHQKRKAPVLELTDREFYAIADGKPFPSIFDKSFRELLEGSAGVDVIPIDEACRGVNNRFVSYYSRLYKIENCRKREIEPEEFLRKNRQNPIKFVELTSEQWLSLPDGKPF